MQSRQLIMLPGPTNVPDRVMQAMQRPIINHRGPEFRELYKRIVEKARYLFQTKGDIFILTCSGTGAIECAIRNIVCPGDKVIVPVNGVFSSRLSGAIATFGGKPLEIPVEWGDAATAGQIEDMLRKGKDAKAVAIVYNETSTGVTMRDLREVGKLCREYGALLITDAISILGGDELPVDDWGVDICVTGSQKCLMCPPGLALISVSREAWNTIEKAPRSYYFDLISYREYMEERWETPYTPAIPLFYALDEALTMIREEGLAERIKRHSLCAKALYAGIEAMGLAAFPRSHCKSNTVIAVNSPAPLSSEQVIEVMRAKYGVVIAGGMGRLRGKVFRIGVMGSVSMEEIIKTLAALESALNELGHGHELGAGVKAATQLFTSQDCWPPENRRD